MHQGVWGSPWACPLDPRLTRVRVSLGSTNWVGQPHYGPCFLIRRLRGWWGGGSVRGGSVDLESASGAVRGDVFRGSRLVTISGLILTESGAQQFAAFDQLAALFATDDYLPLVVSEGERGLSRQLWVSLESAADPEPVSDLVATVSLTVRSDGFPLLSTQRQGKIITSGGVDLVNAGTYPAALTVDMVGPLTKPGLSWPGGAWTYGASIPSGTTLQADMWGRSVWDPAGSGHTRRHAAGTWLSLPPGTTRVSRTGSGSGSLTARWRSSWA